MHACIQLLYHSCHDLDLTYNSVSKKCVDLNFVMHANASCTCKYDYDLFGY